MLSMFIRIKKILFYFFICIHAFSIHAYEIGTKEKPIIVAMVPGQDNIVLSENGKIIENCLTKETNLFYKLVIPTNFIAVVESLGTKRVDVALMNTFGYILAHEKYQSRARLIGTFKGRSEYYGQIITRTNGPKSIKELNGKTFAFVDPASTSGYVLATKMLADENVKLKSSLFAGKHDAVVSMVYQGRVDAGATYHTLPENGVPQDARTLVLTQYPDVMEKIKIIKISSPIPSDPIVFGGHVEINLENKIVDAFKTCIATNSGKEAFMKTYHLDGLKDANDSNWDQFRKILQQINKSPDDFLKK
jgi:phosphonate transport system substrate-binding protein